MLLSRVTAHKITNCRCKYLATMATGDNDDDNEDGATTTTTMTTMVTARRSTGHKDDGGGRQRQRGRWQRRDGQR
jgi:hypothetical protein